MCGLAVKQGVCCWFVPALKSCKPRDRLWCKSIMHQVCITKQRQACLWRTQLHMPTLPYISTSSVKAQTAMCRARMRAGEKFQPKIWWDKLEGVAHRPHFLPEFEGSSDDFVQVLVHNFQNIGANLTAGPESDCGDHLPETNASSGGDVSLSVVAGFQGGCETLSTGLAWQEESDHHIDPPVSPVLVPNWICLLTSCSPGHT